MADELDVIIIDDSDEERVVKPSSKKVKRRHRDSSPAEAKHFGRQSQPISIDDLDSEIGHDAIDVLFGQGEAAGIEVAAAEGVVTVTSTTVINADQADQALPLLINVLPDLDPDYGLKLLREKVFSDGENHTIEHCLQTALEALFAEATYPKVQRSLKRKRLEDSDDEDDERPSGASSSSSNNAGPDTLATCRIFQPGKAAYKSKAFLAEKRKGSAYRDKALVDLDNLFPLMLTAHVNLKQFVPTYFALKAETLLPDDEKPYVPMKQKRAQKHIHAQKSTSSKKGKSKAKGKQTAEADGAAEYEAEREWFIAYLLNKGDGTSYDHARSMVPATKDGDAECSCCFGDDDLMFMVQCAEGHNFCRDCIRKMTEVAVGDQTANVVCPHTDGCEAKFYDRDLRKAMSVKLYNTYMGIIQRKELEEAGIEGLESCPYCNFALIIENQEERLFACQSDDCGTVSCRKCRKHEHLPKTCEEGYDHFNQSPENYGQPKDPKKCRLWDPKDQDLYRDEVAAARENARREIIRNENGDVQEDDVEVALPEVNIVPDRDPYPPFEMFEGGGGQRLEAALANARANGAVGAPLLPGQLPENIRALMQRGRAGQLPGPLGFAIGALGNPNAELHGADNARLQEIRERLIRLQALQARIPPLPAPAPAPSGVRNPAAPMGGLDERAVADLAPPQEQLQERLAGLAAELARLQRVRPQRAADAAAVVANRNEAIADMVERMRNQRIPLPPLPRLIRRHVPVEPAGDVVAPIIERRAIPLRPLARDAMREAPLLVEDEDDNNDNDGRFRLPVARPNNARRPNTGGVVRFEEPAAVPVHPGNGERPKVAPGVVRSGDAAEVADQLNNVRRPRAVGGVRFEEPVEVGVPAPIGELAQLARIPGGAVAAREEVRQVLLNRIADRNERIQRAPIGNAQIPAGVAGLNRGAVDPAPHAVANPRPRGDQGVNNQNDIATLAGAERQLRQVLLEIRRDFPELAWADVVNVARDRGGRRVIDHELTPARRISPRHPTGVPVDPLSVLLVIHQRHPDWTERYYDSLINDRIAWNSHADFNMYAVPIIEGLRNGRIQPPIAQPARRPSAETLRQLHSCWSIGASNLVTLLERVMQNIGVNFPENRRLPGAAASFEILMIDHCPDRILLAHCQNLLRGRLALLPAILQQRRAANIAARPNQGAVANNDARAGAQANRVPGAPIPDDPPPPYEAVGGARRVPVGLGGIGARLYLPGVLGLLGRL
ncbi:hypothetical protein QFC22_000135 [Naganishia vaughanmartiniae]|uniref:Uncharacterized protein n=1 Tax=Naganishia vaughanmartiniae TaxID=1424756 RepID=A0ACC2XNI2_9TREE|nr:hypothetical protein QFC22_000135 [Naganishia vaughanmartiniae]